MTAVGNIIIPIKSETYNRLFFAPFLQDKMMFDVFQVFSDMRATEKKQMLKLGNFSRKTRRASGCGFNPVGDTSVTERWLETIGTKIEAELCWDELKYGALAPQIGQGNNYDRIENTQISTAIAFKIGQGAMQDAMELAFYGDTNSSNPFFNVVDGLWKYFQVGVTNGEIKQFSDKSNTPLKTGEAIELMRKVYKGASKELRGTASSEKIFFVSPDIFYQLQDDLIAGLNGADTYTIEVLDGRDIIRFYGVEIRCMESWGELGESQLGLDQAQNLIVYTRRNNFVMGTDGTGMNADVMMEWQSFERKVRYRLARPMGFNYIHPELIAIHR